MYRRSTLNTELKPRIVMTDLAFLTPDELLAIKRELIHAHAKVLRELLDRGLDSEGRVSVRTRSPDGLHET